MYTKPVADDLPILMRTSADLRAAAQLAADERALARRRELESQASPEHAPEQRIRIWERLHALSLPASASHPLVAVIASQTRLSVANVNDEQQRRRSLLASEIKRPE